jgi:hypothetical protein
MVEIFVKMAMEAAELRRGGPGEYVLLPWLPSFI